MYNVHVECMTFNVSSSFIKVPISPNYVSFCVICACEMCKKVVLTGFRKYQQDFEDTRRPELCSIL